jgi:hypothetical protein
MVDPFLWEHHDDARLVRQEVAKTWAEDKERLISERRAALLALAPEVLVDVINNADEEFWRDPRFSLLGYIGLPSILVIPLVHWAVEDGSALFADYSFVDVDLDGAVEFEEENGGVSHTTPRQRLALEARLDEVVGKGQYQLYIGGGFTHSEWEVYCYNVHAMPVTFAAAAKMRQMRLAGEFSMYKSKDD